MGTLWSDPVWSKVIAAAIIAGGTFIIRIFWKQIKSTWQALFKGRTAGSPDVNYYHNQMFVDLFIKNIDHALYRKLHGHEPEYKYLIENMQAEGFISVDEKGDLKLSRKGRRLVAGYSKRIL